MLIPEGSEVPNLPQRGAWPRGNTRVTHSSCPQPPVAGGAGWDSMARSQIPALPELLPLGSYQDRDKSYTQPSQPPCTLRGFGDRRPLQHPHPEPPRSIPSAQDEATTVQEDFIGSRMYRAEVGGVGQVWGVLPTPWLRAGGACPAAAAAGLPSA